MSHNPELHPKAYLISKRNVKPGLVSRSKILHALEESRKSASIIARETTLSYECVTYHLMIMKKDHLVECITKTKPFAWGLTPYGQQKLPT
jgi:hypothetical protein